MKTRRGTIALRLLALRVFKFLSLVLSIPFVLSACSKDTPVESEGAMILLDSLRVRIVRDETPGFPYPRMHHEMYTKARLSKPGFLITYIYRAADVASEGSVDGSRSNVTTPREHTGRWWSGNVLAIGQRVPVYVQIDADISGGGNASLSTSVAAVVEQFSDGAQPEVGSVQLTGPGGEAAYPRISRDGQRVFYLVVRNTPPYGASICVVTSGGGSPSVVFEGVNDPYWLGWYTLTHNDSVLVYSLRRLTGPSMIASRHLFTGDGDTVATEIIIHHRLADVPGTDFVLTLAETNSSGADRVELILLNWRTGTVETLAGNLPNWTTTSYGMLPGTRRVYYNVRSEVGPPSQTIYVIDLDTRQHATLMDKIDGFDFCPAFDGESYAVLAPGETPSGKSTYDILFMRNGASNIVTTYAEPEWPTAFSFFPGDDFLVVAVSRRGDKQIWKIPL